ncbi:hypothetical protein ACWH5J_01275 [Streptococcus gallolyticus]
MYFYIIEEKLFFNILLIFLNFNFLTLMIKTPIKLTQHLNYDRVKKAANGQLPECRQNLLFNKVSYKELLSLFNLRIICEQSEQQNDTYRRGESGCNINKTSHPEVLREWYRIPIFIVRCTTPAQLTRLVAILRSKMRTASQPLRLLGIPWIPSTVHWTVELANGTT